MNELTNADEVSVTLNSWNKNLDDEEQQKANYQRTQLSQLLIKKTRL